MNVTRERERREQSLERPGKKFYVIKSRDAWQREKALYHLPPGKKKRILKGSTRPFLLLKSSLDDVNAAASLSNKQNLKSES